MRALIAGVVTLGFTWPLLAAPPPPPVIGTTAGTARDGAAAIAAEAAASNAAAAAQSTANGRPVIGTTSGTARDAALAITAETNAQNTANTAASNITAMSAKMPPYASTLAGTMYASTCNVVVNTSTPVSTFCPVATDSTSATKRTYPAGSLVVGRAFKLEGGGMYSVPLSNMSTANIAIKVGSSSVVTLTTPIAPVGNNQGVTFIALCSVRTSTTIACNGRFSFNVSGTGLSADAPFDASGTFTPGVDNVIDVTGNWNGTITSHSTTVTQAVLTALN